SVPRVRYRSRCRILLRTFVVDAKLEFAALFIELKETVEVDRHMLLASPISHNIPVFSDEFDFKHGNAMIIYAGSSRANLCSPDRQYYPNPRCSDGDTAHRSLPPRCSARTRAELTPVALCCVRLCAVVPSPQPCQSD